MTSTEERELRELCESIDALTTEVAERWRRESRVERLTRPRYTPGDIERRVSRGGLLEFKRAGTQAGKFSGYASKFDEPHETSSWQLGSSWSDVVAPGSFTTTLAEHKRRGTLPAMLCQHDMSALPVGAWRSVREDAVGLRVDGELALATDAGRQVFELMQMGAMTGLSIGFRVDRFKLDERARLRTIQAVSLFEISPLSVPADPGARVNSVTGDV